MVLELGLEFEVFCLEEHETRFLGNRFLTELLLNKEARINFVARQSWAGIYEESKRELTRRIIRC